MSNGWRNTYNCCNNIIKSYYIFGIAIVYIAVVSSIVLSSKSSDSDSKEDSSDQIQEKEEQEDTEDMTRSKKLTNRIKLNEKHEKQRELDKQNQLNKQIQLEKQRELEKQKEIQEELERIKQQKQEKEKEMKEQQDEKKEEEIVEECEEQQEEEECEEEEEEEQFSMFGVSIEKLMDFQRQQDQEEGGDCDEDGNVEEPAKIPIVLSFMLDRIKLLDGFKTEGLFRVNGNLKNVEQLATEGFDPFSDDLDPNVNTWASLLKKWIRDLPDPIIPYDLSPIIIEFCNSNSNNDNNNTNNHNISNSNNNSISNLGNLTNNNHINNCNSNNNNSENIDKKIENILNMIKPDDHKYVIYKIGEFFGEMLQDEAVEHTKMNIDNLSKILTPSLFKPNNLMGSDSPIPKFLTALDLPGILQKQKKEIEFVSCLLSFFKRQYLNKLQQEEEQE